MIIRQDFNEISIPFGSLVFIRHIEKPYKTGWWLKTKNYNNEDECKKFGIYVLVKPVTDFERVSDKSRCEHGKFIMKGSTLQNNYLYNYKYEIMATIVGVESVIFQEDNYKLTSRIFWAKAYSDSDNIKVTDEFIELLKYINEKNNRNNDLYELSKHILN